MSLKRMTVVGAVTLAVLGANVVAATGAAASPTATIAKDGWCDTEEVCLYYNSNLGGGMLDVTYNLLTYVTEDFKCSLDGSGGLDICNGSGSSVWNNAASVRNKSRCDVVIYYNTGQRGPSQLIPRFSWANLNATLKNNNASHKFVNC
ncbi:peptidase inhibitor family I36 protein [Streptomyces sp. NBC_01353]|uniref:peptidase inhibitor family I36 protein n=1 Tax=Streptomyces sp. NBC_01353 TaxID=2903835 RepID=UPI002E309728|nr:peptidase inhibitor family I36 protein [Streptomyces sp. NBC_01353]